MGESQDEKNGIPRRRWTWRDRPDGWWYFLPMCGWMVWLAVNERGVNQIISAVLAAAGALLVISELRTGGSDDLDEESVPETLTEAEVRRRYPGALQVPIFCIGRYGPTVNVQPVDPRDIELEWNPGVYRVYFWSSDGGRCDEHELSGARDVREVISWTESNAAGRVPEIFVRHDHPPQFGLIRLAGARPGSA